jgi:hypothetical protein
MAHSIQNLRSSGVLQPTHSGGMDAAAQGRHGRHSINLGKPQMRLPQASAGAQAHAPLHQRHAPTQLPKAVHILKASPQAQQALQSAPAGPQLQDRERMIDSDQLKTRMRREPKQNARLFGIIGPRIWPRGTTYRNVVNQLADYRQATGNMPVRTKVEDRKPDIAQLDARLARLESSLTKRLAKKDETPMREMLAMVQRERQLLQSLDTGKDLPRGAQGASYERMLQLRHVGMPPAALVDIRTYNERTETSRSVLGHGAINTVDKVTYQGVQEPKVYKPVASVEQGGADAARVIGIESSDPRTANRNVATYRLDQALGLGLIPETEFAAHDEGLGVVMDLAKGRSPQDKVKAPLLEGHVPAIKRYESELNSNLLTESRFLEELDKLGIEYESNTRTYYAIANISREFNSQDATLMNKLNDLEWIDAIGGQADRNPGNYLIEQDDRGNVINLKGVDNDVCFGKRSNDPKSVTTKELPRLVDYQTAQRIKAMAQHWHDQPGGMKETLRELLSPEEVAAAEKRLLATQAGDGFKGLLEHIGELEQPAGNPARAKGVVPHGQWGVWTAPDTGKSAYETLTAPGAGPGSYVKVLELQQQQQKQKFG